MTRWSTPLHLFRSPRRVLKPSSTRSRISSRARAPRTALYRGVVPRPRAARATALSAAFLMLDREVDFRACGGVMGADTPALDARARSSPLRRHHVHRRDAWRVGRARARHVSLGHHSAPRRARRLVLSHRGGPGQRHASARPRLRLIIAAIAMRVGANAPLRAGPCAL